MAAAMESLIGGEGYAASRLQSLARGKKTRRIVAEVAPAAAAAAEVCASRSRAPTGTGGRAEEEEEERKHRRQQQRSNAQRRQQQQDGGLAGRTRLASRLRSLRRMACWVTVAGRRALSPRQQKNIAAAFLPPRRPPRRSRSTVPGRADARVAVIPDTHMASRRGNPRRAQGPAGASGKRARRSSRRASSRRASSRRPAAGGPAAGGPAGQQRRMPDTTLHYTKWAGVRVDNVLVTGDWAARHDERGGAEQLLPSSTRRSRARRR